MARTLPIRAPRTLPRRIRAAGLMPALLLATAMLLRALPASAAQDIASICDRAANNAAVQTGVPISVLKAISLTETGRNEGGQLRPWPWTVNMEGKGVWFETEDAARAYVYEHFKRGARSFDVGCFQINYKWHHENFTSIEQMFDPEPNALYAARFLADLYAELGSWNAAAGAYHSRTPEYADRYAARFASLRERFLGEDGLPLQLAAASPAPGAAPAPLPGPRPTRARVNTYPLLQTGGTTALGSLVPLAARSGSGGLLGG